MQPLNQVLPNVNNVKTNKTNNVNVLGVKSIALKLTERLNDPDSYRFFCKVAWSLPENVIWNNLEQAQKGRNPKAYFTFLCKLSMG